MYDFEAPSPQTRSGHDYTTDPLYQKQPITYKAGQLEAASVKMFFDGKMDPSYLEQGFQQYDGTTKTKVYLPELTAYVLGLYFGSFSNGQDKGDTRYQSNLVEDTTHDILHSYYFVDGKIRTLALGNYKQDIAPAIERLNRNSSYTKVLVCYIAELQEVRAIHLGATAEAGFVRAMAKAWNQEEWKTKMYGLSEMENEIWVFKFNGESEPVTFSPRDAKRVPATLPADRNSPKMYFQPILQAGVIRSTNAKYAETFQHVAGLRNDFATYILSEQADLKKKLDKANKAALTTVVEEPEEFEDRQAREASLYVERTPPIDRNIRPNQARTEEGFDSPARPYRSAVPQELETQTVGTPLDDLDQLPF